MVNTRKRIVFIINQYVNLILGLFLIFFLIIFLLLSPKIFADTNSELTLEIKKSENIYLPYLEVGGEKCFHDSSNAALIYDLFIPLLQKQEQLLFTDLRIFDRTGKQFEGNIHLGYRKMSEITHQMLGIYGAFDRKRTLHQNFFNQLTLGFEYWQNRFFVGGNVYMPIGGRVKTTRFNQSAQLVDLNPIENTSKTQITTQRNFEKSLGGGDAQVGYEFTNKLTGYAGGYYFAGNNVKTVAGPKISFTYDFSRPNQRILRVIDGISLEAGAQYDNIRKKTGYIRINFKVGLNPHDKTSNLEGFAKHMIELVRRDQDIMSSDTNETEIKERSIVKPLTKSDVVDYYHIAEQVAAGKNADEIIAYILLTELDRLGRNPEGVNIKSQILYQIFKNLADLLIGQQKYSTDLALATCRTLIPKLNQNEIIPIAEALLSNFVTLSDQDEEKIAEAIRNSEVLKDPRNFKKFRRGISLLLHPDKNPTCPNSFYKWNGIFDKTEGRNQPRVLADEIQVTEPTAAQSDKRTKSPQKHSLENMSTVQQKGLSPQTPQSDISNHNVKLQTSKDYQKVSSIFYNFSPPIILKETIGPTGQKIVSRIIHDLVDPASTLVKENVKMGHPNNYDILKGSLETAHWSLRKLPRSKSAEIDLKPILAKIEHISKDSNPTLIETASASVKDFTGLLQKEVDVSQKSLSFWGQMLKANEATDPITSALQSFSGKAIEKYLDGKNYTTMDIAANAILSNNDVLYYFFLPFFELPLNSLTGIWVPVLAKYATSKGDGPDTFKMLARQVITISISVALMSSFPILASNPIFLYIPLNVGVKFLIESGFPAIKKTLPTKVSNAIDWAICHPPFTCYGDENEKKEKLASYYPYPFTTAVTVYAISIFNYVKRHEFFKKIMRKASARNWGGVAPAPGLDPT
jgi:hypothetical protein